MEIQHSLWLCRNCS